MLQKHDLELDGVFDGVAIVFHQDGIGRGLFQLVHQADIGFGFSERRDEILAREAKALRSAVVRSSEDDESLASGFRRGR